MDKLVVCEKCGSYNSPQVHCACKQKSDDNQDKLDFTEIIVKSMHFSIDPDIETFLKSLQHSEIRNGDIRIINMPVKFLFLESNKIIDEVSLETGSVKFKHGFYMIPIMEDDYVYQNQPSQFYANAYIS